MKKLVIFDLDGTLLNTISDLANATNYALVHLGYPAHHTNSYRFFVGNGINKLFERALPPEACTEENVLRIRQYFLPYYDANNTRLSHPYTGILQLLKQLRQRGVMVAVASNKYQAATAKLIAHYFHSIHFEAVLGQREGVPTKPDPAIVFEIMEKTGVKPEEVLYVGDSGVDMATARRAGVDAVGVAWGFRPRAELVEMQPRAVIDSAEQLLDLL